MAAAARSPPFSLSWVGPCPKPINQRPDCENHDAYPGVQRRCNQRADDQTPACQDKHSGRVGMPRNPNEVIIGFGVLSSPKNEESGHGQPEEKRIDGDDIIQDLIVFAGERDNHRPDALEDNRDDRHTSSFAYSTYGFEENAVPGHGVIDAWRGQDALTEKTDGRDRDAAGDELCSARTERV